MKRVIKINFTDFWKGFDKENNYFVKLLSQLYDVRISEEPDFLFHRLLPDLIISPSLDPTLAESGRNIRRVGPIVREGFSLQPARSPAKSVLVMLSGSRFGSPVVFNRTDWPFDIEVVGRPAPESRNGPDRIRFYGKLLDNKALVEKADLVVVSRSFRLSLLSACDSPIAVRHQSRVRCDWSWRTGSGDFSRLYQILQKPAG